MKRPTVNFVVDDVLKKRIATLVIKHSQETGRIHKEAEILRVALEKGLKAMEVEEAEKQAA